MGVNRIGVISSEFTSIRFETLRQPPREKTYGFDSHLMVGCGWSGVKRGGGEW